MMRGGEGVKFVQNICDDIYIYSVIKISLFYYKNEAKIFYVLSFSGPEYEKLWNMSQIKRPIKFK